MPLSQVNRNSISGKHLFGKLKPIFYGVDYGKNYYRGDIKSKGKNKINYVTQIIIAISK